MILHFIGYCPFDSNFSLFQFAIALISRNQSRMFGNRLRILELKACINFAQSSVFATAPPIFVHTSLTYSIQFTSLLPPVLHHEIRKETRYGQSLKRRTEKVVPHQEIRRHYLEYKTKLMNIGRNLKLLICSVCLRVL